jgi:zinc transporter 1/2/3
MFNNPCLGTLQYESTTGAVAMAGIFLTFLLEYLGNRTVGLKRAKHPVSPTSTPPGNKDEGEPVVARSPALVDLGRHHHHVDDVLSVLVMEAGIIFHSVSK